jgi:hypothetical protein
MILHRLSGLGRAAAFAVAQIKLSGGDYAYDLHCIGVDCCRSDLHRRRRHLNAPVAFPATLQLARVTR